MQELASARGAEDSGGADMPLDLTDTLDPDALFDDGIDLRSVTDGVAMLGRFEAELADYESSLRRGQTHS